MGSGSRLVNKLRDRGVEVSKENEYLINEHFNSLPQRYAVAVKDAMSEVRITSLVCLLPFL